MERSPWSWSIIRRRILARVDLPAIFEKKIKSVAVEEADRNRYNLR
jgi:hypothetical protein